MTRVCSLQLSEETDYRYVLGCCQCLFRVFGVHQLLSFPVTNRYCPYVVWYCPCCRYVVYIVRSFMWLISNPAPRTWLPHSKHEEKRFCGGAAIAAPMLNLVSYILGKSDVSKKQKNEANKKERKTEKGTQLLSYCVYTVEARSVKLTHTAMTNSLLAKATPGIDINCQRPIRNDCPRGIRAAEAPWHHTNFRFRAIEDAAWNNNEKNRFRFVCE